AALGSGRDVARVAFVRLGRAFPPALPTLARVRLQRLSPNENSRNRAAAAENAANFFRSSTRAAGGLLPRHDRPAVVAAYAVKRVLTHIGPDHGDLRIELV